MNDCQAIAAAETFLRDRGIDFVPSATIQVVSETGERVEIGFPAPDSLIPGAVVDPPDIRVAVDTRTGFTELVPQM